MLTGAARPVAESVARELGIDTVFAQVLPSRRPSAFATSRRRE